MSLIAINERWPRGEDKDGSNLWRSRKDKERVILNPDRCLYAHGISKVIESSLDSRVEEDSSS
jgi:hypothetical protein